MTEPPGAQAPLHVHHREDEGFYVLEGSVTLHVGDETIEARAGDFAFGPRDVPHRYDVGPDGCRMLFICTPGGFERPRPRDEPAGGVASRCRRRPTRSPTGSTSRASPKENGCELLG